MLAQEPKTNLYNLQTKIFNLKNLQTLIPLLHNEFPQWNNDQITKYINIISQEIIVELLLPKIIVITILAFLFLNYS